MSADLAGLAPDVDVSEQIGLPVGSVTTAIHPNSGRAVLKLTHKDGGTRYPPRNLDPETLREMMSNGPTTTAKEARGQRRFAYRLAEREAGKLLHAHGLGWHVWDGTRWVRDEGDKAAKRAVDATLAEAIAGTIGDKAARKDIERVEVDAGIRGILNVASYLETFSVAADQLDADPYALNVSNGTLDLHTFELRAHDPADRITKITNAAYHQGQQSPEWEKFLAQILPDAAVRAYLARSVGLGLIGKVVEHVLTIWTGTGANGKGTAERAFKHAFGTYAIAAEPDLLLLTPGAHPTGQMDLRGMRWATVTESDEGKKMAQETMKRLTGGDRIRARHMRSDFVEFEPSHSITLITNHLPEVSGDDPAVWRRVRVVPFDVVIPENARDNTLDDRFELAADSILAWAVEGYRDYVNRAGMDAPDAVLAKTDEYRINSDTIARFVEETCVTTRDVATKTAPLHKHYEQWCRGEQTEPLSSKAFGQALDRLGWPATKVGGERIRQGITFRVESPERERS